MLKALQTLADAHPASTYVGPGWGFDASKLAIVPQTYVIVNMKQFSIKRGEAKDL